MVLLLLAAPQARAAVQPPDHLPQIWGVEVDDAFVGDADRLAPRLKAAGVTLVAGDGLSAASLARLQAIATRANLPLFQPPAVLDSSSAAAADAGLVVVRAAHPRAFRRLAKHTGAARTVGILRLAKGSYRPARWRGSIVAAQRSPRLDLVVKPDSARVLVRYLGQMTRIASGDRKPPSSPKRLAVNGGTPTSLAVAWKGSSDNRAVAGYGLYRDGAFVGSTTRRTASFAALSCEAHLLQVDAVDRAGNRSAKSSVTATPAGCSPGAQDGLTPLLGPELPPILPPPLPCILNCPDTTAPSQPGSFAKTGSTQTSVSLSWSASTDNKGVTGYRVYRDGSLVASPSGTSTTVGSLVCGRSYQFGVEAVDQAGNASSRATLNASTNACPPAPDTQAPSVPPNQRYTSITRTAVTLAWDAAGDNVGVSGYYLYLNGSRVATTQQLSYTYSGLTCGTSYTFALEAFDAAGNVSDRAHATGTRSTAACEQPDDTQAPTAPGNQRITSATASSLTLAWDASTDNTGVTGYRVFRDGTSVGTTTSLGHTFSGLTCATSYTLAVEAYDAAGNTSSRVQVSGSTSACAPGPDTQAPTAPGNARFTATSTTSVTMAWDASSDNVGVAGYRVYRDGASLGTTTSLSYAFGGLSCGTSYTFAVEAYDSVGNTSSRSQGTRATDDCEQPQPTDGTAHLWIDANGGTCTRSSTPAAYNDAAACGTASQAYNVANGNSAGSTILIRGGTYTGFSISGNRTSTNRIVFDAAPGETVVWRGGYMSLGNGQVSTSGPDYVTVKNMATAEFGSGYANPDNRFGIFVGQGSSFIRLENMRAGNFLIQASQNIEVIGGEYGPCRASDQGQPCEINKVDHYPGAPQPKNILIDGVHFHDYDLGPSCFKPSDGGNSTGNPDCHWRSMYLNGVHDVTLRNSRFRESFIAPWMTISGPDASRTGNKNILVENNVFGTGVNYGNPGKYQNRGYGRWEAFDFAWCQNASSGVMGYENVTFRFNSSSRAVGLFVMFNEVGCQQKVRNVRSYGNIGYRNGCDALTEYRYNVYSNSGTCDASDRNANAGGALPFYAVDTHSPGPNDYALTGANAAPDNLVPASMGCPATDRLGRPRGQNGFCDAGAYER